MLASASDAAENALPADKLAAADSASVVSATGRGMRVAAKRKPLATIVDNGQTLAAPPPARSSLQTPAKPAGPVSASAQSPGLLRGFFAFLSPDQKREAADAAATTQATDNAETEQAAQTAIPLSESLDWASQEDAASAATTSLLLPLSPPQLPSSSKTFDKSPMATLLSAMKPVAAAAATSAQPRSLASSFIPAAAAAAAASAPYHANLHAVLQPYASLLPPEMLSAAPHRPTARKSDSALFSTAGAGASSPAFDMLSASSSSPSPQPSSSTASGSSSRFVCAECSKGFPSNSALSMHLLVHSDCKPFVCPAPGCSKAFRQKGHLISHHRKHTGEKPFVCPATSEGCSKRFKDKSGLNTHVKRQHPTVSCAHVTAVAPADDAEAAMDPGLAAAIANANVMLAEMQNLGAAAAGDAMMTASGSSTPLPIGAPRSRTVPGSTTLKNVPAVAANAAAVMPAAPAPAAVKQPAAKKRSHSSLGLAAASVAPSASSPSPSSLPLHLRRSLTPSLDASLSSSSIMGGGGDELELERLASHSSLDAHPHHSESSMHMLSPQTGSVESNLGATPSTSSLGSSAMSDAQIHPLMKRSRSESPALNSHGHSHSHSLSSQLPKLHLQSAVSGSRSFSPIPSPILFFNPAAAAAAAASHTSSNGRGTPTSSWMAQIPLPHASLAALYAAPLLLQQQQQQHSSASSRSNAASPSPHAHAGLPPPFGSSHSPVFSSSSSMHDAAHHSHGHLSMLPMMMFNSAASSAFSFKNTQSSQQQQHNAANNNAMQQ